jgi:nucleotide-binding universal stress UspA family protein
MESKSVKQYNNIILVPTDFSEVCDNAINHGAEMAKSLGYKLCILHVINRETKSRLKKENLDLTEVVKTLKEIKAKYAKKNKIEIDTIAVEGSIFSAIQEVAHEIKANMMVLGTHGKKGLQKVFGSYALRVVLESPIPVFVVQKRSFGHGFKEIVFPVSNDLEARQKVQNALKIAKLFNSRIHIFQSKERDTALQNRVSIITRQITEIFDKEKVKYFAVQAEKASGYADQVLSYAVLKKADLIMIMTQPNVDVPGFSMSNWDEKLMFNDAQIPVMCTNPLDVVVNFWESSSSY